MRWVMPCIYRANEREIHTEIHLSRKFHAAHDVIFSSASPAPWLQHCECHAGSHAGRGDWRRWRVWFDALNISMEQLIIADYCYKSANDLPLESNICSATTVYCWLTSRPRRIDTAGTFVWAQLLRIIAEMGLLLAKLYNLYENFAGGGQPSRIVMLGLDAAGKCRTHHADGHRLRTCCTTPPTDKLTTSCRCCTTCS